MTLMKRWNVFFRSLLLLIVSAVPSVDADAASFVQNRLPTPFFSKLFDAGAKMEVLVVGGVLLSVALLALSGVCVYLRLRRRLSNDANTLVVGFFHPYCNSGGGGERVLWELIQALHTLNNNNTNNNKQSSGKDRSSHRRQPRNIKCIVYTVEKGATPNEIREKAASRFNLHVPASFVSFHYLSSPCSALLSASTYPFFTLLGQSVGSMLVAVNCFLSFSPFSPSPPPAPHIFFDSMGYAFTYPIATYLAGVTRCCCYTHYPTISTDMLQRVHSRRSQYNNRNFVAQSFALSRIKLVYYHVFAWLYGVMGRRADLCLVNSTWTKNHIDSLFYRSSKKRSTILYPPVDTVTLAQFDVESARSPIIVSIGQFRPEKDHELQLHSFARFLQLVNNPDSNNNSNNNNNSYSKNKNNNTNNSKPQAPLRDCKLVLIGGVRDDDDEKRVARLQQLAVELGIQERVSFEVNIPYSSLLKHLQNAVVGLHTMWNEHFGISVVEFMAAGVITIAHNSGGPKSDIVVPSATHDSADISEETGFLASTVDEYALCLLRVLSASFCNSRAMVDMRHRARVHAATFSSAEFQRQAVDALASYIA